MQCLARSWIDGGQWIGPTAMGWLWLLGLGSLAAQEESTLQVDFQQSDVVSGERELFVFEGLPHGMSIVHLDVFYSCCFELDVEVSLDGPHLRVVEMDRGPECLCPDVPWTVTIDLSDLSPRTYDVEFYRARRGADPHLVATARIDVPATETQVFVRSEWNRDETVDLSDAVGILSYLFLGAEPFSDCLDVGDVNDDGALDVSDGIALLQFLFSGGPPPSPPFDDPGEDPTRSDPMDCRLGNTVTTVSEMVRSGDFNGDDILDLTDGIALLSFLAGVGRGPVCEDAVDTNDDGVITLSDLCGICRACCPGPFAGGGGGEQVAGTSCEVDTTPDRLGCLRSGDCL